MASDDDLDTNPALLPLVSRDPSWYVSVSVEAPSGVEVALTMTLPGDLPARLVAENLLAAAENVKSRTLTMP